MSGKQEIKCFTNGLLGLLYFNRGKSDNDRGQITPDAPCLMSLCSTTAHISLNQQQQALKICMCFQMAGLKMCLKRQAVSPGCGVSRAFLTAQARLFGAYGEALQDDRVSHSFRSLDTINMFVKVDLTTFKTLCTKLSTDLHHSSPLVYWSHCLTMFCRRVECVSVRSCF